jgi:diguanylate cyclase (GGDEF)-like protein/PAS domain S-box-containing protein
MKKNISLEKILNLQEDIIIITDIKTKKIVYGNKKMQDFFDMNINDFIKKFECICNTFEKYNNKDYLLPYINEHYWVDYILRNPNLNHKAFIKNKNGFFYHFEIILKEFDINKYLIFFKDISKQISEMEEIKILKQYKMMIDENLIVSKTDTKGIITFVNEEFCDILGYTKEELIGKSHNIIKSHLNPTEFFTSLWKNIKKGNTWNGKFFNLNKNGSIYVIDSTIKAIYNSEQEIIEYISFGKDITKEFNLQKILEKQNLELKVLSNMDSLTDSFNRRGLEETFKEELSKHFINKNNLGVVMIDIDYFKKVNDTYGHDIGDKVISTIVSILKNNIKNCDIVSRYGGEEFLLILPNTDKQSAAKLSDNLRQIIENTNFEGVNNQITVSCGVSDLKESNNVYKTIEEYMHNLIKISDIRLYEAKKQGRNRVVCGDYRNYSEK